MGVFLSNDLAFIVMLHLFFESEYVTAAAEELGMPVNLASS
jgi:hypothetical protein